MAAKKSASAPATGLTWKRNVASSEGLPILVGAPAAVGAHDENEGPSDFVEVTGTGKDAYVMLDTEGGGAADIGYDDDEVLIVLATSDFDSARAFARIPKLIAKAPEYLAGEITLGSELAIDAFRLPRRPGTYVVVEGFIEDEELRWCRLVPPGRKTYGKRPALAKKDPVEAELASIELDSPKGEAQALEAALRIIDLGRPDLALDICAKTSPARRALATWTRVMALAAQKNEAAAREATALAEEWLRPADSTEHPSQALPRKQLLRALDAAGVDPAFRERVASSPEPDVYVADTGGDFF